MNFLQGRPLRLAGVALIGIAAIAAVIGIVTAVSGGGGDGGGTAAPPAPSASSAPGSSSAPATSAPPSSSGAPAPPPSSPAAPPPPAPAPGQNGAPPTNPNGNAGGVPADQASAKWVPVRVYNNSTIPGLAARASQDLRGGGWNVVETSNYPYGVIPTTTAYYTPGTDEETAAKALASSFAMKAEPRFEGIKGASGGVIIIVTNDYQGLHAKGS